MEPAFLFLAHSQDTAVIRTPRSPSVPVYSCSASAACRLPWPKLPCHVR